jgi:putative FmdB family regulatory protein
MPTYEYQCQKCNKRYEVFQSITEKPIAKCKFCNGKVKRLIGTGSGIIFKGSGFYATDYRKDTGAAKAKGKDKPASCPAKGAPCQGCPKADL